MEQLVESLENAQAKRLTYLENLRGEVKEWQHDRGNEPQSSAASCKDFFVHRRTTAIVRRSRPDGRAENQLQEMYDHRVGNIVSMV